MSPSIRHPAHFDDEELLRDCKITRTRRSGPGGQHRNKVESAIVIEHVPTGLIAEANERRSQHENRKEAIERLRIVLAIGFRMDESQEEIFKIWKQRTNSGKISVSRSHRDFAALLAFALDRFQQHDFDFRKTAENLEVSSSQLTKFLKLEPKALQWVNQKRQEIGQHPLK